MAQLLLLRPRGHFRRGGRKIRSQRMDGGWRGVYCETVSPRNVRRAIFVKSHQHSCLNKPRITQADMLSQKVGSSRGCNQPKNYRQLRMLREEKRSSPGKSLPVGSC